MESAEHLPKRQQKWVRALIYSTLGFVGLHSFYWLPEFPVPNHLWGFGLFVESLLFFPLAFVALVAFGIAAVAFLLLVLPLSFWSPRVRGWIGYRFTSSSGRRKWASRPWLYTLAWILLFLGHMGLDIDPYLTVVGFSGLLLLLPKFWAFLGRRWSPLATRRARVTAPLVVLWLLAARDPIDVIAAGAWGLVLLLVAFPLARVLAFRDRITFALYSLVAIQLFAVVLPLWLPTHGGAEVGHGFAYSFCEAKSEHRLFAAVPRCAPNEPDRCRMTSTIDEFDARTLQPRTQHRFFSERYTGRLEQLLCLDESVQVGMDFTVVDGQELKMSLLEFQLDDPRDFTPNALGGAAGDGMAYDRRRGVVYYRSEDHELIRLDLATRQIDRQVASAIEGGLAAVGDLAIHEGRDSLFIMQAYGEVTEVDLETLEKKAEYPILAAWEIAIDEELDRLYAAGNWGLEVVDLQNGRTLKRTRLGLGGRRPAIDARNDLLYVPSTAGGRIQVFDRRSLKKVGSLRLGVGPRYPYVSAEHGYLLATNIHSYYSWNLDELAKHFR